MDDSIMDYPQPAKSIDELPQRYEGLARERYWQDYWRACGVYDFSPTHPDGTPRTREELYTVDTPPPTVSGALHIGHVFSYTQTDFSVRYQRMTGKHVFYPFGFDDNGLPSERLVERVTGKRAFEVGREAFIEMCRPILEDAEQQFKDLWQSLALSCDWTQFYTTINPRSRAISQASFIDLYNKGYVYRKEAPTMWCWADQTAIAQAEIEDREVPGHFHDIVFHWADGPGAPVQGELIIATTRPELIPACVAVFAHPDDERYKHLFGKVAITPLFEVEVPILPSEKADPEKGTGILMCCTFGDTEDVEHWEQEWPEKLVPRRKLPARVVVGRDGRIIDISERRHEELEFLGTVHRMVELAAGRSQSTVTEHWKVRDEDQFSKYSAGISGLKINAAQVRMREELAITGLLRGVREIKHVVRHSERGGVPIEILLTPQWYIRLLEFKDELIAQGRKVNWHPEWMCKRYEHWVEGLNQDWCISRQRYNGVPFPVWYLEPGMEVIIASHQKLPVNPLVDKPDSTAILNASESIKDDMGGPGTTARRMLAEIASDMQNNNRLEGSFTFTPEPDVMDTWATSSLTPLLNTHLIIGQDDAEVATRHAQIFPYDLRPQAHDIIRTWAFYTIVKALYHFGSEQGEDGKWRLITDEQKLRQALPWKDIVISGHAQDAGRKKISKSKGHVVTPAQMVEKYTADGLRYWSSGCKLGTDTLYDEEKLGEGKRLITKLFNAGKFALRHLLDFDPTKHAPASGTARRYDPLKLMEYCTYPTDRWILWRLKQAIERAGKANAEYEFGDARQAVEEFFWADFCDNYLELCKGRLYGEKLALDAHPKGDDAALRLSAQCALFLCLSSVLRMFAPVLPHIAEECWSWYHAQWYAARSIHEAPWPCPAFEPADEGEQRLGQMLIDLLALVRKWKSEHNVSIKKPLDRMTVHLQEGWRARFDGEGLPRVMGDLIATCNAVACSLREGEPPAGAATLEGLPYAVSCELAEE